MRGRVSRLRTIYVTLRAADFFLGAAYRGICARKLCGQLRNLQHRQHLTFFYVIAHVDIDISNVAGDFGVYFHVLERLELPGDGQSVAQRPSFDAYDRSFCDVAPLSE